MILLDSTVIVGFLDADDALHKAAVARFREIVAVAPLAASAIGYAEVMTGAQLGHHREDRVAGFFDVFIRETIPVDRAIAGRAASIRAVRRALAMPDALILATADLGEEIDTVLCADADWPKVTGLSCRVELLKP